MINVVRKREKRKRLKKKKKVSTNLFVSAFYDLLLVKAEHKAEK